jgi:hypothetical protein
MKRPLVLVLACLFVVLAVAAGSAPAKRSDDNCSWGASSIVVEQVNGQYVQGAPETSGCIPNP